MTDHANLMTALLAVQAEAPKLQKDAINPHFKSKYISLDALHEAIMPVLNRHDLVWLTLPSAVGDGENARPTLTYRLVHAKSGEEVKGVMPLLLAKQDPQGQGSAITYARRYALMAVLGLVADEDDDGNGASAPKAKRQAAKPPPSNLKPETLTALREAYAAAQPSDDDLRKLVTDLGVQARSNAKVSELIGGLTEEQATWLTLALVKGGSDA